MYTQVNSCSYAKIELKEYVNISEHRHATDMKIFLQNALHATITG